MNSEVEVSDKRRSLIFINILITCIASSMLATALTTALPAIASDLNIDFTTGQWLTSGYALVMAIMMPLTAFLITRFPTKKLYLFAILLFIFGLVLSVISDSFFIMMIGRVLQASGNGILASMAQVILLTIYPLHKRGAIMGWYGLSIGASPVIAPTIAGILVDNGGWRTIFYIVIVIMVISFLFAMVVFNNFLKVEVKRFDVLSFIVSVLAFGGVTLGIGNAATFGLLNYVTVIPLIIGVIFSFIFVYRQLNLKKPFLDLRVLKSKEFTLALIASMLLYLVMMGTSIMIPLYVQTMMGESATISGLVTLPGSLAMAIVSPFAGKIYDKIGIKKLFIVGALMILSSNIGMIFISLSSSIWLASVYAILRSIGIGCLMMPLVTWGMSKVTGEMIAHGTALLTSLRTIAGAIGSALFVGIMSSIASNSLQSHGEGAQIHGLNVAFMITAVFSVVLLLIPLLTITKDNIVQNEK